MILAGKTAFVTGGSRGIGLEIVKAYIENGAKKVAYFSRSKSSVHSELEDLAKQYNSALVYFEGSVNDEQSIQTAIQEFATEAGSLDILVNNAGITNDKLIIGMKKEDWEQVLDINLNGVFYASKVATKLMIKQRSGAIINVSSIVGITGNPGQTNYSASKAAIIGFSKSLAKEVAKRGVRVNVVAPGFIATEMTEAHAIKEEMRQKLLEMIPMARIGNAEEIAKPCVFLASDMASYITGEVIKITGGMGA